MVTVVGMSMIERCGPPSLTESQFQGLLDVMML